jgi:hypothetical protein
MLWRAYRLTGQAFGLAIWVVTLIEAFFGNVMETPAGAIPLYLTIGMIVGPTLSLVPLRASDPSDLQETYESEAAYMA